MAHVTDDVVTDEAGLMVGFQAADDVEALLTDRTFGAVAMTTLQFSGVSDGPLHQLWSLLMFGKDGDAHRRLRRPVSAEFTPKAVERYRSDIDRFATELAAAFDGEVELWTQFALPLSARASCRIVGIPESDADMIGRWGVDLVGAFFLMSPQMRDRAEAAAVEFSNYLEAHLDSLRAHPGDDVASRLLRSDADHDLAHLELRALVANLVFGGLEATAKAITTGTHNLIVEGQWDALVARPEMVAHAVSELLRFSPPIGPARVVTQDATLRDVPLHAGQMAVLDVASACRDPRHYDNADALDITREPGRQLAFGAGPHFCLGANLAKITLESAFATLTHRLPGLKLSESRPIEWDHDTFHGIVQLPVVVN
jgi:cytochrome P450